MSQSKRSSKGSSRRSSRRKRKLKQKVSDFSKSVGLSPLRIILSLLLLIGVIGLIIFLGLSGNSLSDQAGAAELTAEDLVNQEAEIDEQLKALFNRRVVGLTNNFLLSINEIENSETEISDLEASCTLTPSQEEIVARIRLRNKGCTVLQMLRNDLSLIHI